VPPWPDNPDQAARRFPAYVNGRWFTSAQRLFDNPRIPQVTDPQPGDLVYFERTYQTPDRITHVAIITAPGRLLGAQQPRSGYLDYGAIPFWRQRLIRYYGRPHP